MDPRKLEEEKFMKIWQNMVPDLVRKCNENYIYRMKSDINQICFFLEQFKNRLKYNKANADSQSLFLPKANVDALNSNDPERL